VTDARYALFAHKPLQGSCVNAPAEHWLAVYDADHSHAANRMLHHICAPIFLIALLGLLWCLPMPAALAANLASINWATLFAMATVVYYFVMSITLALGSLPFLVGAMGGIAWLDRVDAPLLLIASVAMLAAALGQFVGHRLEAGGSLFRDLLYCVIGPIWALAALYRKLGIPY